MTANALAGSHSDFQGEVAIAVGWNRTAASWTSVQTGDFARINKEALQQVYFPGPLDGERSGHIWSYLRPLGSLTLNASYATGTVAVAANGSGSVVTLTTGTWPSWAAAGDLWVDGGRYSVKSRTNGTTIVLDNVSVTVTAGTTYELIQHYYDLPTDFGGIESNAFTYRRDQSQLGWIKLVHEGDYRRVDSQLCSHGYPTIAAVVPVAPTTTVDAQWQVMFHPIPVADLVVEYRYAAIPPVLDGTTYIYHHGGAPYSACFRASYVDCAMRRLRRGTPQAADARGAFMEALRNAVMYDRNHHPAHTLGMGGRNLGRASLEDYDLLRERRAAISGLTL